jgi:hypothetical protein
MILPAKFTDRIVNRSDQGFWFSHEQLRKRPNSNPFSIVSRVIHSPAPVGLWVPATFLFGVIFEYLAFSQRDRSRM